MKSLWNCSIKNLLCQLIPDKKYDFFVKVKISIYRMIYFHLHRIYAWLRIVVDSVGHDKNVVVGSPNPDYYSILEHKAFRQGQMMVF